MASRNLSKRKPYEKSRSSLTAGNRLTSDVPLARKALIASSFSSGHAMGEAIALAIRWDSTAKSWTAGSICMIVE